jgi:Ca2+-binding RTX toxin-like protein
MASKGVDTLIGGEGFDTVDFSRMTGFLDLDLSKHSYAVGAGNPRNSGKIWGFEEVYLSDSGSTVMGSDSGSTTIWGGAGNDWIRGKMGNDTLFGGEGSDTFVYLKKDTRGGSVDTILDFDVGSDRLDLTDFLKGNRAPDSALRFSEGDGGVMVQGLVGGRWVDVVKLAGVAAGDVDYASLGLLGA